MSEAYILRKFRRYEKARLGGLVPLEVFTGLLNSLAYLEGCRKKSVKGPYQPDYKVYLVVSSEFYESVLKLNNYKTIWKKNQSNPSWEVTHHICDNYISHVSWEWLASR